MVSGFESLLRWSNEKYKNDSPYEYIRIAEKKGLIVAISKQILKQSFMAAKDLMNKGYKTFHISVNISIAQLMNSGFVNEFISYYKEYDLPYSFISIEITETMLITSFDEVKDEYKDKITYEELGYKAYNASLESAYMEAMQKLENNSYTKEPVQTSYGYHVIYRIDQKEKPALKDVKEEIITSLVSEHKSKDTSVQYKALDKMREDAKLKFTDTVLEKKYETYKSQYNK